MAKLLFLLTLLVPLSLLFVSATDPVEKFLSRSGHTNNWAVLVCSSRFWFNYRVPPPPTL
jgi:GPI-anchor transamidase subunit K